MKKLLVLFVLLLTLTLLLNDNTQKRDFEYGTYESNELIRAGLSSTLVPTISVGKPSGMEYIIDKNKYIIRNVVEDKYSTLKGGTRELIYNNVTYEEVTLIPDYKISIWEKVVEDLESVKLYKVLDENNNKIDFEIVILNGNLYIMDRNSFSIDMIKMSE